MTAPKRTPKLPRFLDKDNPLERKIEDAVCRYAKDKYGIENRKYANPGRRSAPDRIFFNPIDDEPANVFFIEFKRLGEKPTPAQQEEHEFYRKLGFVVFVCDSVKSGKTAIDRMAI